MAHSKTTPLLELLDQRWRDFVKDMPDPTIHVPAKRPDYGASAYDLIRSAARLHAEANNSDPFAYGRMVKHIQQGFVSIGEARSDAMSRIAIRKGEGVTFPAFTGA